MSDTPQPVTELRDDATREEIIAYIKNKPPLYTETKVVDGMRLCFANPALVETSEEGEEGGEQCVLHHALSDNATGGFAVRPREAAGGEILGITDNRAGTASCWRSPSRPACRPA